MTSEGRQDGPVNGETPEQQTPQGEGTDQHPSGASATEVVQTRLILENIPEAAAWPPDWASQNGVEFFYRKGSCLVRDWHVERVLAAFRAQEFPGEPEELSGSLTRIRWDPQGDDDLRVPELLRRLANPPDGITPLPAGLAAPEHLFYVCVHSCAATEQEPVPSDAPPVPRPQIGQDASDPRCAHGDGVAVRIFDTGLVEGADQHPWTTGVTGDVENPYVQGDSLRQDAGHGTFVAGCVRVAAPESSVHVVNATVQLPHDTSGTIGAAFESELAELIRSDLVAPTGGDPVEVPDILLLNFAGTTQNDAPPVALSALYDDVIQHLKELLILAPAGNEGATLKNWPGSFAWVVSVGALADNWRDRATFSNYGRHVDVFAPGKNLVNAYASGVYTARWAGHEGEDRRFEGMARWSGTSFSTPLVAGLVASRMSTTGQRSRRAWLDLLDLAERQAIPGVGPVLYPGQGCGTRRGDCEGTSR